MSTRALIATPGASGRYSVVYLHYDGQPEHAGVVLQRFHASQEQANALCSGVEIRSLDPLTGAVERFRDGRRFPEAVDLKSLSLMADKCGCGHVYVYNGTGWTCIREELSFGSRRMG